MLSIRGQEIFVRAENDKAVVVGAEQSAHDKAASLKEAPSTGPRAGCEGRREGGEVKPSIDCVGKRVDRLSDIIYALHAGTHARRIFTDAEAKRLIEAHKQLDAMLRQEKILL